MVSDKENSLLYLYDRTWFLTAEERPETSIGCVLRRPVVGFTGVVDMLVLAFPARLEGEAELCRLRRSCVVQPLSSSFALSAVSIVSVADSDSVAVPAAGCAADSVVFVVSSLALRSTPSPPPLARPWMDELLMELRAGPARQSARPTTGWLTAGAPLSPRRVRPWRPRRPAAVASQVPRRSGSDRRPTRRVRPCDTGDSTAPYTQTCGARAPDTGGTSAVCRPCSPEHCRPLRQKTTACGPVSGPGCLSPLVGSKRWTAILSPGLYPGSIS